MNKQNIYEEITKIHSSVPQVNRIRTHLRAEWKIQDRQDIEDILQDVFLSAYKSAKNFTWNGAKPITWLYKILENKAKNFLRNGSWRNNTTCISNCFDPPKTRRKPNDQNDDTLTPDEKISRLRSDIKDDIRLTQGKSPELASHSPWPDSSSLTPRDAEEKEKEKDGWLRSYDCTGDAVADAMLAGLSEDEKKVFLLYEQGFTSSDIKDLLKINTRKITKKLRTAYTKILVMTLVKIPKQPLDGIFRFLRDGIKDIEKIHRTCGDIN